MDITPIDFINNFKGQFANELENVFLYGYCYYFALILARRFKGAIYYLPIDNHFVTKINHKYYDITGEIKQISKVYKWSEYKKLEPIESKRIIKYCIKKL